MAGQGHLNQHDAEQQALAPEFQLGKGVARHGAEEDRAKIYDLIYMMADETNPALTDMQSLMYLFYRASLKLSSMIRLGKIVGGICILSGTVLELVSIIHAKGKIMIFRKARNLFPI